MKTALVIAAMGTLALVSGASADTIATFSDPAASAATPLFSWNATTSILTGGWSGSNLLLQTPGVAAQPDYANATFTMSPLGTLPGGSGSTFHLGAGQINFFSSTSAPLLTISFADAWLTNPVGFGGSDFMSNTVTFSGPLMSSFLSVSNEAFAFSFANPSGQPNGSYSATSSFTSSANVVVPGPGAVALLGLGGLIATRRRR